MSRITRCRGPEGAMPPHIYSPAMIGRAPGSIRRGFDPSQLETLWETPAFLHWAGLGRFPKVGPELTDTGTIIEGAPIALASGGALRTDRYSGTSYRATSIPVDPGANEDTVFLAAYDFDAAPTGGANYIISNYAAAKGFTLYRQTNTDVKSLFFNGAASRGNVLATGYPVLALSIYAYDGATKLYTSPASSSVSLALAGPISSGAALGIGATGLGSGIVPAGTRIAFTAVWHGVGISTAWTADRVAELYALAGVA